MKLLPTSLSAAALLLSVLSLRAEVKLPAIFGAHMVLQAGANLPVWGTADPGETVTVSLGGSPKTEATATADANGKWKVELPSRPASPIPTTLTVTGKNVIAFGDVLIGEVWICSGQSNMEFGIGNTDTAAQEIPNASHPEIRLFCVPKKISLTPLEDIGEAETSPGHTQADVALLGHWQVCTPDTVARDGGWGGFSAVAYFFGRDIQKDTGRPVGLIATSWGGTRAQAWTSVSGLRKDAALEGYAAEHDKIVENLSQSEANYKTAQATFEKELAVWQKDVGQDYAKALAAWKTAANEARAAGQPAPPTPQPASPKPRPAAQPTGGPNAPANLFNGMVAPLVPYAITGAIWYQGEANAGHAEEYRTLFKRMITDWREKWAEGDFPFLFVELASFGPGIQWPQLREAQSQALSLPNTGMATAVDIGDPADIHPKDKIDVGARLALAARRVAYGENLVSSGPVYKAMQTKGGSIAVTFTSQGGGLVIGSAPWVAPGFKPLPTDTLMGFVIAGDDRKWARADAKIDGDAIVVSNPAVPHPAAVRYDWANAPEGNLYNKEGLPAPPFRTDNWDDAPEGAALH